MEHHKVTLEQVARAVRGMGLDGFTRLSQSLFKVGAKHGDKTIGQVEALLNMISPEDQKKLLSGKASIRIEGIKSLFDETGRVIPFPGIVSPVVGEDKEYCLPPRGVPLEDSLKRIKTYLPEYENLSLSQFRDRFNSVKEKALNHPLITGNAFSNRCYLPLPIPRIPELSNLDNLGKVMDMLLNRATKVYQDEFPEYCFYGDFFEQVTCFHGINHVSLLTKISRAPQTGILLLNPLQGFSINAQREMMIYFPDFVSLAGLEYLLAMICYPQIFTPEALKKPILSLSALSIKKEDSSYFFETGYNFSALLRSHSLDMHYPFMSGGLFLLG